MHVAKLGEHYAVRLPRALVDELRLKGGRRGRGRRRHKESGWRWQRTSAARRRSDGLASMRRSRFRQITGSIESKPTER